MYFKRQVLLSTAGGLLLWVATSIHYNTLSTSTPFLFLSWPLVLTTLASGVPGIEK
jgi:hypothetical protein